MTTSRAQRSAILISTLLCATVAAVESGPAGAQAIAKSDLDRHVDFDIPAQPLANALIQFSAQTGLDLSVSTDLVEGKQAAGLKGTYSLSDALRVLLQGTDLEFVSSGSGVVALKPARPVAGGATGGGQRGVGTRVEEESAGVEEIIVTAQKRSERLQDVPVPVTALDATSLVNSNQLRLQDYYTRIPGLSFSMGVRGEPFVVIRGVTTTGNANPTVGIVVDDVPYGSSSFLGGGASAPDIDPSELQRIEVLRGPQGTLYGASSIGGLLKFVTVEPSTDALSGSVQTGITTVHGGDDPGYSVRGAVNVPLSDTVAIRASGFSREDPGYIDNPVIGIDDVNSGSAHGGRLSALWRPSNALSLKLSALFQKNERDGMADTEKQPGLGDLQQDNVRGTGWYEREIQAYSATLVATLGEAELTSISGYSKNAVTDSFDFPARSQLAQQVFGVTGSPVLDDNETTKFTQEVRVSMPIGTHLEWLVGGFYTDEDTQYLQSIAAADHDTGAIVGSLVDSSFPTTYTEYAAFTNLTVTVTDRFDVQVGGRYSENRQSYRQTAVLYTGAQSSVPPVRTEESAFTYLVTPRLKLSSDLMIYARFASGFRPGGPNIATASLGLPQHVDPDKTQNYELGVKGRALGGALSFDASVYYIDWQDIQLSLLDPASGFSYLTNTSGARSQGVELSLESHPYAGATLAASFTWGDAELTKDFPAAALAKGKAGDRLPLSARFTSSVSLEQAFDLTAALTGFAGASVSYVGDRRGDFHSLAQRQAFPSYVQADLRGGVRLDSWSANLFVNNLTDERGVLSGGLGTYNPTGFAYIQPRTIGLSLTKTF